MRSYRRPASSPPRSVVPQVYAEMRVGGRGYRSNSLGLNQNIRVLLQHRFTDHLLGASNGLIARYAQIRQVLEKSNARRNTFMMLFFPPSVRSLLLAIALLSEQFDERIDFLLGNMFFQELLVVVQQGSDRVFGENVIANLRLHERELLGDSFLQHTSPFDHRHASCLAHLILSILLLAMLQYAIAQTTDALHLVGDRRVAYVSVLLQRRMVRLVVQHRGRIVQVVIRPCAQIGIRSFEF